MANTLENSCLACNQVKNGHDAFCQQCRDTMQHIFSISIDTDDSLQQEPNVPAPSLPAVNQASTELCMSPSKQKSLTSYFSCNSDDNCRSNNTLIDTCKNKKSSPFFPSKRQRRSIDGSHFGVCPLCGRSLPLHHLPHHASNCNGEPEQQVDGGNVAVAKLKPQTTTTPTTASAIQPIPGLFLFQDFLSEEEEAQILAQLDGLSPSHRNEFLPWTLGTFNGTHWGKRWGVHCNLRDRRVSAPEHPLPDFVRNIVLPKLKGLKPMANCTPNEANAIDYRVHSGHHLTAHVDDRRLSKEPIANLSLAGDCYMTFRNVAPSRNTAVAVQRVLLKRRCLQILTGRARYDFSHEIENKDLLCERRVSVTMRESPITSPPVATASTSHNALPRQAWWERTTLPKTVIAPTAEPIPGLFLYHDFITPEEETSILKELDDESQISWKSERHTGTHREKRFGVDHDLWSREVRTPKHSLPACLQNILIPKLMRIAAMHGCVPNEVNAIDYRRHCGDYLKAHVDDRNKHSEPIANLSLCSDSYMTFRNSSPRGNLASPEHKILLKRRCLQVMTGQARYDFTHAIDNRDLLGDRRVSLTMRETRGGGSLSFQSGAGRND